MNYILLSFFLISFNFLEAQTVSITIDGINTNNAVLFSLQGEKTFFIDSIKSTQINKFSYQFVPTQHHPGIYFLQFGNNRRINFIYDGEDVDISADVNSIPDSVAVNRSESNKLFYSFINLNKQYKTKTELLQLILARYPKDDDYYAATRNKFAQLQKQYLEFVNLISQKNPNNFIARYIRSSQLPVVDFTFPLEKQLVFLKSHALDKVDFKNSGLIYSDVFTNKTIEYLTYYRNPQLPKELLEKEFMIAVDSILNKAKINQLVYQHITEYMIDGFKKFGLEQTLDYIIQNYVIKDDLCLDSKTESSIQRRIDQNKKLYVNAMAPNIILPDVDGKNVDLEKTTSDKLLIVYYASWCPHCKDLIPELNKFYNAQREKKFEVIAISLDEKKDDWLGFIKSNNLKWINVSDLKGWNSKAASDYYVYATPTMFLLDGARKILGKPLSIDELKQLLK
ncbi:MAG: thioredoxin-like domain-containing protein [Ignavibacteriales bacterium]|nr:thioredoxin-like domain-containing protein [Ignavibacteriales bacterium]